MTRSTPLPRRLRRAVLRRQLGGAVADRRPRGVARAVASWVAPADLASVMLFLASEDADYIVAQTYNIDGGNWMRIMCNLGTSGSTARRNPLNSAEQSRSLHWCVISRGSLQEKRKCEGVRSSQRRTESAPGAA